MARYFKKAFWVLVFFALLFLALLVRIPKGEVYLFLEGVSYKVPLLNAVFYVLIFSLIFHWILNVRRWFKNFSKIHGLKKQIRQMHKTFHAEHKAFGYFFSDAWKEASKYFSYAAKQNQDPQRMNTFRLLSAYSNAQLSDVDATLSDLQKIQQDNLSEHEKKNLMLAKKLLTFKAYRSLPDDPHYLASAQELLSTSLANDANIIENILNHHAKTHNYEAIVAFVEEHHLNTTRKQYWLSYAHSQIINRYFLSHKETSGIEYYQGLHTNYQNDPWVIASYCQLLIAKNRRQDALPLLLQTIKLHQSVQKLFTLIPYAVFNHKSALSAIENLKTLADDNKADQYVYITLGKLYSDLESWHQAISAYETALSMQNHTETSIHAMLKLNFLEKNKSFLIDEK